MNKAEAARIQQMQAQSPERVAVKLAPQDIVQLQQLQRAREAAIRAGRGRVLDTVVTTPLFLAFGPVGFVAGMFRLGVAIGRHSERASVAQAYKDTQMIIDAWKRAYSQSR